MGVIYSQQRALSNNSITCTLINIPKIVEISRPSIASESLLH